MENVDHPFARGGEDQTRCRIIRCRIDTTGNGKRLDDFPAVSIKHHQHLRIASGAEQTPVIEIDGKGRWVPARRDRPAGFDLESLAVDSNQLSFVLYVDVYS